MHEMKKSFHVEINDDDDATSLDVYIAAPKMASAIWKVLEDIRSCMKYQEPSAETIEMLDRIREALVEFQDL